MGTPLNVVVGHPANIKIGSYGTVEGSATDVGYTEGGARIIPSSEYFEKRADQAVGVVGVTLIQRSFVLEFNMAEASLQNLQWALGLDSGALEDSTNLNVGATTTIDELTIYVNGPGPGAVSATRKVTCHKCVSIGNPEYAMVKDDKTIYACQFLILEDTSKSAGKEFYEIDDSGADTTAPTVAMTTPAEDGTVSGGSSDTVTLTFTEAGAGIDEGTLIDGESIMIIDITDQAQTAKVAGTWVYTASAKTLVFTPSSTWGSSKKYQIVITTQVTDIAGNALASVFLGHFTSTA